MRPDRMCRAFYEEALDSLKAANLLENTIEVVLGDDDSSPRLLVKGNEGHEYDLGKGCYIVGFGKAVLGLGAYMCHVLGEHVVRGILSVPEGIGNQGNSKDLIDTCERFGVQVMEGAKDNLPDKNSNNSALQIKIMVENLTEDDVVVVLISGGGSALLPLPIKGIDLDEKIDLVSQLSKAGASITELNTVRKKLSALKGGKLSEIAFPAKILTLILSDIIGNPLDMIASGPTVANTDHPGDAFNIIKKYKLEKIISNKVLEVLNSVDSKPGGNMLEHVENIIIGSNSVPLYKMMEFGNKNSYNTVVLSDRLDGEARTVGVTWASLAHYFCRQGLSTNTIEENYSTNEGLADLLKKLKTDPEVEESLRLAVRELRGIGKPIALLAGGETTVTVTGKGKGGRNQEMVLAFSLEFDKSLEQVDEFDVAFLSCGTDGIDGPTPAAGAVCLGGTSRDTNLQPDQFLQDNDSWNFWRKLEAEGVDCLVKPGHTGTNVMDVQVLVIQPRAKAN